MPSWAAAKFPPAWISVCGILFATEALVWNQDHSLLSVATEEAKRWVERHLQPTDPLIYRNQLFADPAKLAVWMLHCLESNERKRWNGVADRDPKLLEHFWETVLGSGLGKESPPVLFLYANYGRRRLHIITPKEWIEIDDEKEISKYLPDPGPDWKLVHKTRGAKPKKNNPSGARAAYFSSNLQRHRNHFLGHKPAEGAAVV